MTIRPLISLQVSYTSTTPTGFVTSGVWTGFPNEWQVTFTVTTQPHGFYDFTYNGFYDGTHVETGQWIGIDTGDTVLITSIISQSGSSVTAIVRDVDEYNINKSQIGQGLPTLGGGFIFELGDLGQPMIDPGIISVLAPTAHLDIISRFAYIVNPQPARNWLDANANEDFDIGATATSGNAMALGHAAIASDTNAIAIGSSAQAAGQNSIAIGDGIIVTDDNVIAFGNNNEIKLYIDADGYVGLGLTDPSERLELFSSAADNYLKLTSDVATDGVLIGLADGSNDLRIANLETADLALETGGFERIRIDSNEFISFMHGEFNSPGDAEYKFALLRATNPSTVSGQQIWLTLPNSQELTMPDETVWIFDVEILGKEQGGTISAGYKNTGMVRRGSGAATIEFVGSPYQTLIAESVSAFGWETGLSADPATGSLRIYGLVSAYSGPNNVNWLAMVKITEINF